MLPHEGLQLGCEHGLRFLAPAPASGVQFGQPPRSREDSGSNRYLWLIDDEGIPYLIEAPLDVLGGNLPKHSNLTGARDAYIAGELWFDTERSVFVSGGSGRYGPTCEEQLFDAAEVFGSLSYQVACLGWIPLRGLQSAISMRLDMNLDMNQLEAVFRVRGESLEDAARRSPHRYVRSNTQLALYDESRKPNGHVMTAWEALHSYGLDALVEVVEYGSAILLKSERAIESTLRATREALGVKPLQLARAAGSNGKRWRMLRSLPRARQRLCWSASLLS